jgi:two-component system KDP operon response regulator KdpE
MRNLNAAAARARCRSSLKAGRIIVAGSGAGERAELRIALELEGHQVGVAETVAQTLEESWSGSHHALILASRFEGIETHALCRKIRLKSELGIIVLAGNDTTQGRIDAWNAGADDYLSSPFVYRELLARVRAVLRRVARFDEERPEIILQDRAIDLHSRRIRGPGSRVSRLTPKEFLILRFLVDHANVAVTHRNLAQTAWDQEPGSKAENIRFVIKQLRGKIEPDPDHPRYILSERSVGYRFHMAQPAGQNTASELSSQLESRPGLWAETKWERPTYSA